MIQTIKSFFKVAEDTSNFELLFIAFKILFINEKEACSVEYRVLNLYFSLSEIELVVIWSRSLAYISFSITFEKEVSKDTGLKLVMS